METSIKIEYWALHSHILTYFQKGGSFDEAISKWNEQINIVKYFWRYYTNQKI